jgi:NCAIR mutase (PurE)-related protein
MSILKLLKDIKSKKKTPEEAYIELKDLPFKDLGFAKVDLHRKLRKGFPEVIFCQGKETLQITEIAQHLYKQHGSFMATRASENVYEAVKKKIRSAKYYKNAKMIVVKKSKKVNKNNRVLIVTAGTADIPVAEEAAVTLEFLDCHVKKLYDAGVAGIHRLLKNISAFEEAKVIIVIAGMEGALPSVVAGLTEKPVVAVPTSIGYGANFKGLSALLSMLNTCSPGVAVVNIDNGFGAGVFAYSILKTRSAK